MGGRVQPIGNSQQELPPGSMRSPPKVLLASPVDAAMFLLGQRRGYPTALLTPDGWDGSAEFNLNAVKIAFLHIQKGSSYFAKCLIMLRAWWNKSEFVEMASAVSSMADAARTSAGIGQLFDAEFHCFFDQCDSNAVFLGTGVVASAVTCDLLRMLVLMFAIGTHQARISREGKSDTVKPGTSYFLTLLRCPPPAEFTQFDAWSGIHAAGRLKEMGLKLQEHVTTANSADMVEWIHPGWFCSNGPLFFVFPRDADGSPATARAEFVQDLDAASWVASYYRSYLADLSSLLQEQLSIVNLFQAKILGFMVTAFIALSQFLYAYAKDEYS